MLQYTAADFTLKYLLKAFGNFLSRVAVGQVFLRLLFQTVQTLIPLGFEGVPAQHLLHALLNQGLDLVLNLCRFVPVAGEL